jgi:ERCC4-related helicase
MGKVLYSQYEELCKKVGKDSIKRRHLVGKLAISPCLNNKESRIENSEIITGKMIALKSIIAHLPPEEKIVIFDTYRDTLEYGAFPKTP